MFKTSFLFLSWVILIEYASPKDPAPVISFGAPDCPHFDTYFNRLFMFTHGGQVVTTAVFIDSARGLTSFNAYRALSQNKTSKENMYALIYKHRKRSTEGEFIYEHDYNLQLKCGRQVMPVQTSSLTANQWHGKHRKHSPLHDLMIFRLSGSITFLDDAEQYNYKDDAEHKIGPIKTELAGKDDELGMKVKIGGMGTDETGWNNMTICSVEYDTGDVLLDCDELLPRYWGRFICISNQDGWVALASGAMLVSNDKVFGVGSFLMTRGKLGILAFTDVRPYGPLINDACTEEEQSFKKLEKFTKNPPKTF